MVARKNDSDPIVPRVFLHATDQSALEHVDYNDLKKFAAEGEASMGGGGLSTAVPVEPGKKGGFAKETH